MEPRDDTYSLVLRVTGPDRPGITADLMTLLDLSDAEIDDVEQVLVRGHLTLAVALAEPADGGSSLQELLDHFARSRDLRVELGPAPAPPSTTGPTAAVTVLGHALETPLSPTEMGAIAAAANAAGGNIDRIVRLARYPVFAYEFRVTGADPTALARHLGEAATMHRLDVALQPEGLERRAKRLVVLDVDSTLIQDEVIELLAEEAGCLAEAHTGVGGLTLGAGFGRLARRFGLALDNVEAVDIVVADGRLLHASAAENPDLYWGVRGGGGNFGVVTSFEFRLHPMQRQVVGGDLVFPIARKRELLEFYRDFCLAAPDELYTDFFMHSPAGGKDGAIIIHACYSGPAERADTVLEPLRKLGAPLAGGVKPVDYVAIQRSSDRTDPRNEGEYLKSGFIDEFPDRLLATLVDGFQPHPERGTTVFFQHSGGAIGRIAPDATAFPHRRSKLNMFAVVSWPLGRDATPHVKYVKDYWNTLQPFTDGYYTNEVADEAQHYVDDNYQGNLPRLQAVKKKYDPGNLFSLNANVKPA